MTNKERKVIAELSDSDLNSGIDRTEFLFSITGKHLRNARRAISKRHQALVDEKQARAMGTSAVYGAE